MDRETISRRSFLRGATAAVAAPCAITSSALGSKDRPPASERINMGWIGVGGQGTRLLAGGVWAPKGGFISRGQVQVRAVCDVDQHRANNARDIVNKTYGNKDCDTCQDFRKLLARDDIDAVAIATGERWHPLLTVAAAKAGKDIYCEKPASLTIEEVKAMHRAVRRYGRVFQMGTQQRSSRAFRHACELVRNGYIGEVKTVVVGVGGPPGQDYCYLPAQPVPDYLDYDMWLGPIPWRPYNEEFVHGWMAYRTCSGGGMTNWGAHHFDIAQWGLGMDDSGPVEIIPPDGKDYPVLTYRYANGATVVRDPERLQREAGPSNGVMFVGTEGKVAVWRYEMRTWPRKLREVTIGPDETRLYRSPNHYNNLLTCIRTRRRTVSDIAVGRRSISLCHLGNIAYWLDRPLQWNPEKERFVDDPQADRMLYREMRSPWHI